MDRAIRKPEEILAFRSLRQILASKPRSLWSVGPNDNVLKVLQIMAEKDIGCVVVLERGKLIGIVSERDCARRVALTRKSPEATPVKDIMIREVITIGLADTFADGLKLMHRHSIRHLPVINDGELITVISIRDMLAEAVSHHAKIIGELERERLTVFTSTV